MTADSSQQIITSLSGCRALVLAGPGCGKTHLLTRRIIHAHTADGMPFDRMICLTFTNRASREMQTRIRMEAGGVPDGLFVGNLHRFCSRLLFDNGIIPSDTVIIDEDDRDSWLTERLGLRRKFERKQVTDLAMLLYQQEHDFPEAIRRRLDFIPTQAHISAAMNYRDYKKSRSMVDFDDLLLMSYNALAGVARNSLLHSNYKWLQVDEVQDLTPLQLAIIDYITSVENATVLFFGDEQQAIFEFAGAGGPALDRLKERCCGSIYSLSRNYRSPAYLVKLCNDYAVSCLGLSVDLLPDPVDSREAVGDELQLLPASDWNLSFAVAAQVRNWLNNNVDGRIAVLTRTNDEAEDISALMTAHGLENTLVGRKDLFRRVAYKAVLAHLTVLLHPEVSEAWVTLLYRSRSVATMNEARSLLRHLGELGISPARMLDQEDSLPEELCTGVLKRVTEKFRSSYGALYNHSMLMIADNVPSAVNTLAAEADYTYKYMSECGMIDSIARWPAVVSFFERQFPAAGNDNIFVVQLFRHLPELQTFNEGDLLEDERVTVITIHKAKGLEFDDVIIYNAADCIHGRSRDDARVHYVAMSRAKRRLAVFSVGRPTPGIGMVSHHFNVVASDEVEAMALLERLQRRRSLS